LRGTEKLDAALQFIVEYQRSYSGVRVVDVEPKVSIAQLSMVIPAMRESPQRLMPGPNGAVRRRRLSGWLFLTTSSEATMRTSS
jgi:hypothetical protein